MTGTMPATVVLRPFATPLPLGFLGLFVATLGFASFQLQWVQPGQSSTIALAVLGLTVPAQLLAAVFGFLCRDPVAATGMGILSGTWAAAALATLTSKPDTTSPGLGIVLLAGGAAMLVPASAASAKPVAAGVMTLASLRFIVTGVAEVDGSQSWLTAAGWVGVLLAAVALYAAFAFELEGAKQGDVLPLGRRGAARTAVDGDLEEQVSHLAREAGVRQQL
jgi:uncharacterized protein